MAKTTRRTIFYLFSTVFAVITPLIVASSLGYRIDFNLTRIEKTGGIFVKTHQTGIAIFLDGGLAKKTSAIFGTGALLTDISPGIHALRIEKESFLSWQKTIEVKGGIVSEFRDILLAPAPLTAATATSPLPLSRPAAPREQGGFELNARHHLLRKTETGFQKIAEGVNSFSFIGNTLFFVDKNGFLAREDLSTPRYNVEILGRPGFFLSENKPVLFHESPQKTVFLLDASGGLFMLNEKNAIEALTGGVKNIRFDAAGNKALLVKEQSLDILWLKDNPHQPFQKKGVIEQILSLDKTLKDAQWLPKDYAHLVYRTPSGVFIAEIDGRGEINTISLTHDPVDEIFTSPLSPDVVMYRRGKTWFRIGLEEEEELEKR
jgi:hypothetical protein